MAKTLTRAEMEQKIRNGESILLHKEGTERQLITRVEDLPDDATLAGNDPEQQALTIKELERRQADTAAQLERLRAAAPAEDDEDEDEDEDETKK